MDREKFSWVAFLREKEAEAEKYNLARSNLSPITVGEEVVLSLSKRISFEN
jgi:hypothetical protein